jgi:quinoprotein glucose dehydrogenase
VPSNLDEDLGLVFVPLGNQPPTNEAARAARQSSVIRPPWSRWSWASGQVRWVSQTVHHDLRGYEVSAQPVLLDLSVRGQTVSAFVQTTKQGDLFVLDRRTGASIHSATAVPVTQRPAGGDRTTGRVEVALSFAPPDLRERDM